MKVVCINDSNRPLDIPIEKWVKKDEEYTVVRFVRMVAQGGKMGVELEEIDLTDCFPYEFFSADRFAILDKEFDESEQEVLEEEELEI
jgi:hypothetical protein